MKVERSALSRLVPLGAAVLAAAAARALPARAVDMELGATSAGA